MTEKIRRTWRHLLMRTKLVLALVFLCGVAVTAAVALEDVFIPWGDGRYIGTNDDIVAPDFPVWFGKAFKTGAGVWDTNIPAWFVPAGETNPAALDVLFNRALLSNSVIVNLDYRGGSNASLALDLLMMTNQTVVTSNLMLNMLDGEGSGTNRSVNVTLGGVSTIGLQFRREAGAVTVFSTRLSPDADGDGFCDARELAAGSDPNSALSVPPALAPNQMLAPAGSDVLPSEPAEATYAIALGSPFYNWVTVQHPPSSTSDVCHIEMTCSPSAIFTNTGTSSFSTNVSLKFSEFDTVLKAVAASSGIDTDTVTTVFSAGTWASTSSWTYTSVALTGTTNRNVNPAGADGTYTGTYTAETFPAGAAWLICEPYLQGVLCWRGGGVPNLVNGQADFTTILNPGTYTVKVINAWCQTNRNVFFEDVIRVDIEQAATNVCAKMTNVVLNLTNSFAGSTGTVNWTSLPAGLSPATGSGTNFTFDPSASTPTQYMVTARSSVLPACEDSCTVQVFRVELTPSSTNLCVHDAGEVQIALTNSYVGTNGVTWEYAEGLGVVSTGAVALVFTPSNSVPTNYVIKARVQDMTNCVGIATVNVYKVELAPLATNVCVHTPGDVTIAITNSYLGTNGVVWEWSGGTDLKVVSTGAVGFVFTPGLSRATNYTIKARVADYTNCEAVAGVRIYNVELMPPLTNVCVRMTAPVKLAFTTNSYLGAGGVTWSDTNGLKTTSSGPGGLVFTPTNSTPSNYVVKAWANDYTNCEHCIGASTVNVIRVDIDHSVTNVCWKMPDVTLSLTNSSWGEPSGGSVTWTIKPAGLATNSGTVAALTFCPSNSTPTQYVVKAQSSLLTNCYDTCTVRVYRVEFKPQATNTSVQASGNITLAFTNSYFGTRGVSWDIPSGMRVVRKGASGLVFTPRTSTPTNYVVRAWPLDFTNCVGVATVNVYKVELTPKLTNVCVHDAGDVRIAVTNSYLGTNNVRWVISSTNLAVASSGNDGLVFTPSSSKPTNYVVKAIIGNTNCLAAATVNVYRAEFKVQETNVCGHAAGNVTIGFTNSYFGAAMRWGITPGMRVVSTNVNGLVFTPSSSKPTNYVVRAWPRDYTNCVGVVTVNVYRVDLKPTLTNVCVHMAGDVTIAVSTNRYLGSGGLTWSRTNGLGIVSSGVDGLVFTPSNSVPSNYVVTVAVTEYTNCWRSATVNVYKVEIDQTNVYSVAGVRTNANYTLTPGCTTNTAWTILPSLTGGARFATGPNVTGSAPTWVGTNVWVWPGTIGTTYVIRARATAFTNCFDVATNPVLKIDIARASTNLLSSMTNVLLNLTNSYWAADTGGAVTWTCTPAGLSTNAGPEGQLSFNPSLSIPTQYVVTARSTILSNCYDACTVRVYRVELSPPVTNVCVHTPGSVLIALSTNRYVGTAGMRWSGTNKLGNVSIGAAGLTFVPTNSAPSNYVVKVWAADFTNCISVATVNVYKVDIAQTNVYSAAGTTNNARFNLTAWCTSNTTWTIEPDLGATGARFADASNTVGTAATWVGTNVWVWPGTVGTTYVIRAKATDYTNCWDVATNTVLRVDLTNMTFGMGWDLVPDRGGVYSTPHWTATNSSPYLYQRSTRVNVTATFQVQPSTYTGNITLSGDGPGDLDFTNETVAVLGGRATYPATFSAGTLTNSVDFFDPMRISWKFGLNGAATAYAGETSNSVYVCLANPATITLYHTVVHLACSAGHATNSTMAVSDSWGLFTGLNVKRIDGTQLVYWGAYAAQDPAPGDAFSTAGLLLNADGRCGAWARFLADICHVNGSLASVQGITTKNIPGLTGAGFLVKNWDLTTSPPTDLPGVAAQGNANPQSGFIDHAVVLDGTRILDPSYGVAYTNLTDWEDHSLDALLYSAPGGGTLGKLNTPGDEQTQMKPSP